MNQPFTHPSISNPLGLCIVTTENSQSILSYRCNVCSYDSKERQKLIQHAKGNRHQIMIQSIVHPSATVDSSSHTYLDDTIEDSAHITTSNESNSGAGDDIYFNDDILPYNNESISQQRDEMCLDQASLSVLRKCFNEGTSHYLFYTQQSFHGKGMESLLAKCLLGTEKLYDVISENECKLQFSLLDLVIDLTLKQREKLITLFKHILIRFSSPDIANFVSIPLPISTQELRTRYTRGTNSLWYNIPIPSVKEGLRTLSGRKQITYAYLSIHDIVCNYLSFGGYLPTFSKMCEAAKLKCRNLFGLDESFKNDEYELFIKLWSDGFDPNHTKINRGKGIWSLSLTFMTDPEHSHDGTLNTFPLGICLSKDSNYQDQILDFIISEINKLSECPHEYYYFRERKEVKVYLCILCILMDQPERRKRYYLLMGNSKGSSRWGYLVPNFDSILEKVPSCSDCVRLLMSKNWNYKTPHECQQCVNWDTSRFSSTTRHSHDYLCTQLKILNTFTAAESPSFRQLKILTNSTGMNEAAALKIYDHSQNINLKKSLLDVADLATGRFQVNIRENSLRKMVGALYEPWRGSPLWYSRTHDVNDVVDTPMHLIFLGIVKTTISYVADFIKHFKISTTFTSLVMRRMECLLNEYKLSWLKIIPFKNGESLETTGWVSENFCSFSRIFLWFISTLTLIDQEISNDQENDNLPVQSWSRSKLKEFVEKHSIDAPKNAKTERLKLIVNEFIQNNTAHNVAISQHHSTSRLSSSLKELLQLIQSLHYLTSALMTDEPYTSNRIIIRNQIEKYSRLYLTSLHNIGVLLGIPNVWVRVWNAQSLLNLGEIYERFGSIRNFWEGGMQGEGLIQVLKKEKDILNLYNWPVLILQRLLRKRMFHLMTRPDMNSYNKVGTTINRRMSHKYKSLYDFQSYLSTRKVISVLWIHQYQGYYVDIKLSLVGLKLSFANSDEVGRWFTVEVRNDDEQKFTTYDDDKDDAIILMPSTTETLFYTPLSYSWKLTEYSSKKV